MERRLIHAVPILNTYTRQIVSREGYEDCRRVLRMQAPTVTPPPVVRTKPLTQAIAAQVRRHESDVTIRESLYSALALERGEAYSTVFIDSIDAVARTFVYRMGERLVQRGWSVDDAGILVLTPESADVQRQTTFVPVPDGEATPTGYAADVQHMQQNCQDAFRAQQPVEWDGTGLVAPETTARVVEIRQARIAQGQVR